MSVRDADDKAAGISYMVLGIACLSFMDALGKRVAASYSVFQMLASRSTVAIGLLIVLLAFLGKLRTLRTRQPGWHALRSVCGLIAFVASWACS